MITELKSSSLAWTLLPPGGHKAAGKVSAALSVTFDIIMSQ